MPQCVWLMEPSEPSLLPVNWSGGMCSNWHLICSFWRLFQAFVDVIDAVSHCRYPFPSDWLCTACLSCLLQFSRRRSYIWAIRRTRTHKPQFHPPLESSNDLKTKLPIAFLWPTCVPRRRGSFIRPRSDPLAQCHPRRDPQTVRHLDGADSASSSSVRSCQADGSHVPAKIPAAY